MDTRRSQPSGAKNEGQPSPTLRTTGPPGGKHPHHTPRKSEFTVKMSRLEMKGTAYERWKEIGKSKGLNSDAEIASFLMQHYENSLAGFKTTVNCPYCQAMLTINCRGRDSSRSQSQAKAGGASSSSSKQETRRDDGKIKDIKKEKATTSTPTQKAKSPKKQPSPQKQKNTPNSSSKQTPPKDNSAESPPDDTPLMSADDDDEDNEADEGLAEEVSDTVKKLFSAPKPRFRLRAPKKHICDECGATFTRAGGLKVHKRLHTGEKPYKCDECDAAFTQTAALTVHKRKHSGERPFVCTDCGASFILSATLKQHERTHTGEKPYSCPQCHQRFSRSGDLSVHLRKHAGHKPHLCQECGKKFTTGSELTKHKLIHTGVRPYECEVCHRKFLFKNRLLTHRRSHTGEKPFLCTVCGAGFARRSNLATHFRLHTGDKPYVCEECGKRFSDSGNLCKHRRTSHGITPGSRRNRGGGVANLAANGKSLNYAYPHLTVPQSGSSDSSLPEFVVKPPSIPLKIDTGAFSTPGVQQKETHIERCQGEKSQQSETLSKPHDSTVMFKCEDCSASFPDASLLEKHRLSQHSVVVSGVGSGDVMGSGSGSGSGSQLPDPGRMMDEQALAMLSLYGSSALNYFYQQ